MGSAQGALAGTSSFGMSGVNAHMLLGSSQPATGLDAEQDVQSEASVALVWRASRHWLGPERHSLLETVTVSSQRAVTVEYAVKSPHAAALAYLHDHQARLQMPAAAEPVRLRFGHMSVRGGRVLLRCCLQC